MMVSRFVGMKRLVKLWNFLQTVPKERFDMRCWASPSTDVVTGKNYQMNGCGTTACVAGWATCVVPDLWLRFFDSQGVPICQLVSHNHNSGLGAFAQSFGLTNHETDDICLPNFNRAKQPKTAAKAVMQQIETMAKELGYEVLDA